MPMSLCPCRYVRVAMSMSSPCGEPRASRGDRQELIGNSAPVGPLGNERQDTGFDQPGEPRVMRKLGHRTRRRDHHRSIRLQRVNDARPARGEAFGEQEQEGPDFVEQRMELRFVGNVASDDDLVGDAVFGHLGPELLLVTVERFWEAADENYTGADAAPAQIFTDIEQRGGGLAFIDGAEIADTPIAPFGALS